VSGSAASHSPLLLSSRAEQPGGDRLDGWVGSSAAQCRMRASEKGRWKQDATVSKYSRTRVRLREEGGRRRALLLAPGWTESASHLQSFRWWLRQGREQRANHESLHRNDLSSQSVSQSVSQSTVSRSILDHR
jgi:hypothetical protein